MTFRRYALAAAALAMLSLALPQTGRAQEKEKMTKEEWQKQITTYTAQRDSLKALLAQLTKDVDSLKAVLASLDGKIEDVHKQTLALLGVTDDDIKAFDQKLTKLENWANELAGLSNQDLYNRRSEVDSLQAALNDLKKSKIASIDPYYSRIQALQQKIDNLRATLSSAASIAAAEKTYTVGTWAKNRDCLWNISKKKTIYDNPFLWPKIWQGNREQIKDPDLIYKGQKLRIPEKGPLTDVEKKAERRYYRNKVH